VGSTVRQFKRYVNSWDDLLWRDIAKTAVQTLEPEEGAEYDWPEDAA